MTGGDPWFAVCPGRRVTIRAIDRPCGRAGADRLVFRNSRGRRLRFRGTGVEGDVGFASAGNGYRFTENMYPPSASITNAGRFFFLSVYR